MPVLLSDKELSALQGLPYIQACLYIFGIRRYMDYRTGIVGLKRKISHQSLSEEIYIEPMKGVRETGSKSRQQIRRAVKALEKAGLIIIKSDAQKLILECILAKTDSYVQNKADTFTTQQADMEADTVDNSVSTVNVDTGEILNIEGRHTGRHSKNKKADTPPVSGKDKEEDDDTREEKLNFVEIQNILNDQHYRPEQILNAKTAAAARAAIEEGVTREHLLTTIEAVNAYLGEKPHSPTYYLKAVIQTKRDFEKAKLSTGEVKNGNSYKRKSPTQQVLDDWGDQPNEFDPDDELEEGA